MSLWALRLAPQRGATTLSNQMVLGLMHMMLLGALTNGWLAVPAAWLRLENGCAPSPSCMRLAGALLHSEEG